MFLLEERAAHYGINSINLGAVEFTNIYDSKVSQVCLELPEADRDLQKEYEVAFPGCYTQMMYSKNIGTT